MMTRNLRQPAFTPAAGRHLRRTDIGGLHKAIWLFVIFILPLFGILIYMIARPPEVERRSV